MALRSALLFSCLLLGAVSCLAKVLPAVARPRFKVGAETLGSGTAFFVPGREGETVAVTTAHGIDLGKLVKASQVDFRLGKSGGSVARASRFYAPPGRPFSEPGATLRGDYMVFSLDAPPTGARVLEIDSRDPRAHAGHRVRILGVPASIARDEDDLFGSVVRVLPSRIEVRLDVVADLRGWGGAPVLDLDSKQVIGILEAAWPENGTLRLGVAPITGLAEALKTPLAGGLGRAFARYASSLPAPKTGHGHAPAGPPKPAPGIDRHLALSRMPRADRTGKPLLGRAGALRTDLRVEIRTPKNGAIFSDVNGAFVAGRARAMLGEYQRFDVVIVLDTSGSTLDMSGADVNGNGIVGSQRMGGLFGATDPGDSILAAEVAAAKRILQGLDPRNTRIALVSFAGAANGAPGSLISVGRRRPDAVTEEPLTSHYARVERALDRVLARGAQGLTHMSEGVRVAIREVKGYRGSRSTVDPDSNKVILFFTDGQPTAPYDPMMEADNVRSVIRAADQAARAGVKIDSFALGPEALEGPVATVEMAERTGGRFTPVRRPGELVQVIENVSLADIEHLEIQNLSTHKPAEETELNADGSFGALVPLKEGKNVIQVVARSSDGKTATSKVSVAYATGATRVNLPRELIVQRNRLLQKKLIDLRRGNVAVEAERSEHMRRELQLEIERERAAAQKRAARQRKELKLDVEHPLDAGP